MPATSLTLIDLVNFNQELAALVRAGVPLEPGLVQLGRGSSRRLRPVVDRVSARLANGESLVDSLRAEEPGLSPVYVAIVEAGLASGKLPEALETVVRYTEEYDTIRRTLFVTLLYPTCVVALAYALGSFLLVACVPRLQHMWETFRLPVTAIQRVLTTAYDTSALWIPGIPLGLLFVGVILGVRQWSSGAAGPLSPGNGLRLLTGLFWAPGIGGIFANLSRAEFLELLATLVEHRAPLPRALRLASQASSDRRIRNAGPLLADEIEQGRSARDGANAVAGLPALLGWALTTGLLLPEPGTTCRRVAGVYRKRAERRALLLTTLAAPVFVAVLAGLAVLTYCLAFGLPVVDLLNHLVDEPVS